MTALAAVLLLLAQSSGALPSEDPLGIPDNVFPPGEDTPIPCFLEPKKAERLEGPDVQYTPEALAARVEGTMVVKCVITREGQVRKCKVLKGLKHMDKSVVSALEAARYKPATFQGTPIEVPHTFTLRFKLPKSSKAAPSTTSTGPPGPRRKAPSSPRAAPRPAPAAH